MKDSWITHGLVDCKGKSYDSYDPLDSSDIQYTYRTYTTLSEAGTYWFGFGYDDQLRGVHRHWKSGRCPYWDRSKLRKQARHGQNSRFLTFASFWIQFCLFSLIADFSFHFCGSRPSTHTHSSHRLVSRSLRWHESSSRDGKILAMFDVDSSGMFCDSTVKKHQP